MKNIDLCVLFFVHNIGSLKQVHQCLFLLISCLITDKVTDKVGFELKLMISLKGFGLN